MRFEIVFQANYDYGGKWCRYITISWRKQIPLDQTFIFLLTTSAHERPSIENSVLKGIVGFNLAIHRPTQERNYHGCGEFNLFVHVSNLRCEV